MIYSLSDFCEKSNKSRRSGIYMLTELLVISSSVGYADTFPVRGRLIYIAV